MNRVIAALVCALFFAAGAHSQDLSIKEQIVLKNVLAYHKNNLECDDRGSEMEGSEFIRLKRPVNMKQILSLCWFRAVSMPTK